MNDWLLIIVLTLVAGITMPIGASLAGIENIRPRWLETEVRHSVIAFGGGALLAAVALVLVPEGIHNLDPLLIVACFTGGGLTFMAVDIRLAARATPASQLVAMLADLSPKPHRLPKIVSAFALMALLGPVSGLAGYFVLSEYPKIVSAIMLFAAGGILYPIFQDIAPQAKLQRHWAPALGAVAGFLLGVLCKVAIDT